MQTVKTAQTSTQTKTTKVITRRGYRAFNRIWVAATVLPMLAVGGLNWLIDPYDIYVGPEIVGFNHLKTSSNENDRLHKAAAVMHQKPQAIVLGSSRTKQGINPAFEAMPEGAYNLALNGMGLYEMRWYFEYALATNPNPKLVVIGLDFFMFNTTVEPAPTFDNARLEHRSLPLVDRLNTTLSLQVISKSWQTVQTSRQQPEQSGPAENGFAPNRHSQDGKTQWRFEYAINDYLDNHDTYELSPQAIEDFRHIIETCQAQGILYVVFISPSHAVQWETIRATGHWETFEDWKRDLVDITPVWDFSGYNSVTTEPMQSVMTNYTDSSHYTEPVGNWVLQRILEAENSNAPTDFGTRITPDTVEAHIEQIRIDRERWQAQHPDEANLVQETYDRYTD
ncbi:MAG: hypothetical protein AAGF01_14095 [Cyanobacteria bacterium P01_G01_bin.38]